MVYYILGTYSSSASVSAFVTGSNYNVRSFGLARLRGKRFIKCSEVAESASQNVEAFKRYVGGDTITAEEKGRPEFDYKPKGKLFFPLQRHARYAKEQIDGG
jgi:phage/plasmid-associated DNA primase